MKSKITIGLLLLASILLSSCSKEEDKIKGIWKVESPFYKATYHIVEKRNTLFANVLYYNDGTTLFSGNSKVPRIYLSDIQYYKGKYIAKNVQKIFRGEEEKIILELVEDNEIMVTTTIMHKPLIEKWIRETKNQTKGK